MMDAPSNETQEKLIASMAKDTELCLQARDIKKEGLLLGMDLNLMGRQRLVGNNTICINTPLHTKHYPCPPMLTSKI